MNSKSAAATGQQLPSYNPHRGLRTPLKESAVAPPSSSGALSNRDPLARLRDLSGCVLCLNPRDPEVIVELAWLAVRVVEKLDEVLLNAPANDPTIEALRKRAVGATAWPTMVRPGDKRFTETKLARVGLEPVKAKRLPSDATVSNRLARKLRKQIESLARGVAGRHTPTQLTITKHIAMAQLDVSESQYKRLLEILRDFKPLSKRTLKWWNRALSKYVLIVDPKFERFAELKSVALGVYSLGDNCSIGDKISKLERFFHPALKQLATR